jgi:hypothetical protein
LSLSVAYEFHSVRRQELPRASGGFAARMRLQLVCLTITMQFSCPGLEGNVADVQLSWKSRCGRNWKLRIDRIPGFRIDKPFSAARTWKKYTHFARQRPKRCAPIRIARRRPGRRPATLASLSGLSKRS